VRLIGSLPPKPPGSPVVEYCLGFVFSQEGDTVILIKKLRSLYAGKWNGVGGVCEKGEVSFSAMRRECREETGLDLDAWHHSADLVAHDKAWVVRVFGARTDKVAKTTTDEKVFQFPVPAVSTLETAPHVPALVHLTWDRIIKRTVIVTIREHRR
jgi:8-oxo-dGTP pyrophosphatase MutT (NUDIX family)